MMTCHHMFLLVFSLASILFLSIDPLLIPLSPSFLLAPSHSHPIPSSFPPSYLSLSPPYFIPFFLRPLFPLHFSHSPSLPYFYSSFFLTLFLPSLLPFSPFSLFFSSLLRSFFNFFSSSSPPNPHPYGQKRFPAILF